MTQAISSVLLRDARQLGTALRRQRRLRGWTQAEVGNRAGLRQATVSDIERGENARLESLFALLAVLELELTVQARQPSEADEIEALF